MPLDARETDVVIGCIRGLRSVETWIEEVLAKPATLDNKQRQLVDSVDQVGEVRRRLETLLQHPVTLPDWTEANAMKTRDSYDTGKEEKARIC